MSRSIGIEIEGDLVRPIGPEMGVPGADLGVLAPLIGGEYAGTLEPFVVAETFAGDMDSSIGDDARLLKFTMSVVNVMLGTRA